MNSRPPLASIQSLRSLQLACLFIPLILAGCARKVVIGPPIDTTRTASLDVLQRILKEDKGGQFTQQGYKIGPGDIITLQLIGQNEIFGGAGGGGEQEFLITDNPMLALPLIGAIRIHGKTSEELQEELRAAYSKLVINPQPLVIIKKFQAFQVALLGQVRSPGQIPLQPGDTLMDVILRAGGLNLGGAGSGQAPNRYLKIYREKVDRAERAEMTLDELVKRVNEGEKILPREEIEVPIEDFIVNKGFAYNVPIHPNDVIYVPPAGSVSVQGRLGRPGIIFLGPSLRTVRQVLTQAGDLKFGARSMIHIIRQTSEVNPEVYYMNARHISKGVAYDFVLQDGDQLIVDSHPGRMVLEFMGGMVLRGTRAGVQASYNPLSGGGLP